jgi:hypothetical protein
VFEALQSEEIEKLLRMPIKEILESECSNFDLFVLYKEGFFAGVC